MDEWDTYADIVNNQVWFHNNVLESLCWTNNPQSRDFIVTWVQCIEEKFFEEIN